jgi:hypothetical protein
MRSLPSFFERELRLKRIQDLAFLLEAEVVEAIAHERAVLRDLLGHGLELS